MKGETQEMPSMVPETFVQSIQEYIECVICDTRDWDLTPGCSPWFRGQSDGNKPPLPGVLRSGTCIDEILINERFQSLAPMLGQTPARLMRDEWLYLMQHVGVPTRLLDWSEGALIGLFFAVENAQEGMNPGVWLLHPLKLNEATIKEPIFPDARNPFFIDRCDLAFEKRPMIQTDITWPIAIIPTNVHPRMRSQKGCFTLHGCDYSDLEEIAWKTSLTQSGYFKKYRFNYECAPRILSELRLLGMTHSTLFPDHDGLATDLKQAFKEKNRVFKSCDL